MPAETHQHGGQVDAESILELLCILLDGSDVGVSRRDTMGELGLEANELFHLWEAVCEEFSERTLSRDIDPTVFEESTTIEDVAVQMTRILNDEQSDDFTTDTSTVLTSGF